MVTPISAHAAPTYGLSRSPMLQAAGGAQRHA
jgi:hypothetical protein